MDAWCEYLAKAHIRTTEGEMCFEACNVKERKDVEDFSQACYESRKELSQEDNLEDATAFPRCIWQSKACHWQIPSEGDGMATWCDYLVNAHEICFAHCQGDEKEDLESFQAGCRASDEAPGM
jgi:hypothetical protein